MNRTDALPDFVLVDGASDESSNWGKVSPLLSASGAKVTTLTAEATTLEGTIGAVREIASESEKPVILAGHSAASIVITSVAEAIPESIASLVYVRPDRAPGAMTFSRARLIDAVFSRAGDVGTAVAEPRDTPDRVGRIARYYVTVTNDRVAMLARALLDVRTLTPLLPAN